MEDQVLKYTKIIQACQNLLRNDAWKDLKKYYLDGEVGRIENRLQFEKEFNSLLRLQGEWSIAKSFANLERLVELYENEIIKIKKNAKN